MPYTKTTDFAIKDTYLSGNPAKVVKGAEIDTEFENIETNFNSIGPLGTAAAATLTTTATDTTAGRVLKVGDFGLGNRPPEWPLPSVNGALNVGTGFYWCSHLVTDTPSPVYWYIQHVQYVGGDTYWQQAIEPYPPGKTYWRVVTSGVAYPWVEVATSANSLGQGQTWQSVTGSRAFSTTYTNSTGRPIEVRVRCGSSSGTAVFKITVDGADVDVAYPITTDHRSCSAIVPNGATYSLANITGTAAIASWMELR